MRSVGHLAAGLGVLVAGVAALVWAIRTPPRPCAGHSPRTLSPTHGSLDRRPSKTAASVDPHILTLKELERLLQDPGLAEHGPEFTVDATVDASEWLSDPAVQRQIADFLSRVKHAYKDVFQQANAKAPAASGRGSGPGPRAESTEGTDAATPIEAERRDEE